MKEKEVAEYAAAVRMALGDAVERDPLLEDLEDHLAEIAAESGQPLLDRLGPPEAYAAELRAAYGAETPNRYNPFRLRHVFRENAVVLHRRFAGHRPYQVVTDFLPELRPGWWVVRGIVAAVIICKGILHQIFLPGGAVQVAVAIASIWLSVWVGMRFRARRPGVASRALIMLVNVVMAIGLFMAFTQAELWHGGGVGSASPEDVPAGDGTDLLSNIYPYSKDGKPLTGVRLYDQDGKPLVVPYQNNGMELDQRCGGSLPIANAYPLPLRTAGQDPSDGQEPSCSSNAPTVTPRPGDSTAPTPSPTRTGTPPP